MPTASLTLNKELAPSKYIIPATNLKYSMAYDVL